MRNAGDASFHLCENNEPPKRRNENEKKKKRYSNLQFAALGHYHIDMESWKSTPAPNIRADFGIAEKRRVENYPPPMTTPCPVSPRPVPSRPVPGLATFGCHRFDIFAAAVAAGFLPARLPIAMVHRFYANLRSSSSSSSSSSRLFSKA
ncbi:hypothetical protein V9T40_008260 [Parthenolecanium corni]|uniref:Uncharacterized protein n=1 Tax=Parthenolecanium corni TaxID=536013 RepID=A0AAN9TKJ9_9HEMI